MKLRIPSGQNVCYWKKHEIRAELGTSKIIVTNSQSTKICPQVPGRNFRAFAPSSTQLIKNFFIASNSVKEVEIQNLVKINSKIDKK